MQQKHEQHLHQLELRRRAEADGNAAVGAALSAGAPVADPVVSTSRAAGDAPLRIGTAPLRAAPELYTASSGPEATRVDGAAQLCSLEAAVWLEVRAALATGAHDRAAHLVDERLRLLERAAEWRASRPCS